MLFWILEKRDNTKFPYKLTIKQDNEKILTLLVQDRWPGQRGNIFCLRENQAEPNEKLEEVERIPIISMHRYGKRISIVLDRPQEKRCDFIFLKKQYKTHNGEYEQIFWKTQKAISETNPKVKLSTYYSGGLNIIIDAGEKYPWRFNNCNIEKDRLPCGDYALKTESGILAVVERKSFENLVAHFSKLPILHQQLGELSAYKYSALVIEADYSDFLKPNKLKFYPPVFASKAIAEIYAYHPNVQIVFAGNRKLANEWTYRFFLAVISNQKDNNAQVSEVIAKYEYKKEKLDFFALKDRIKADLPDEFTLKDLKERFPEIDLNTIKKIILNFKRRGIIKSIAFGKYSKTILDAN